MYRHILVIVFTVLMYMDLVSPSAVFEVDLLKYEALPNKCCDGFKHIHFGPLKCNECDPYFKICLRELPSGSNHCVQTSRENNVHTQDLTSGNIQPNHLSMALNQWKGSLLVDVDIKDFDSTTKDDDIDHLFYTYTGLPDPTSNVVIMNGTKVRMTVAVKIYCSTNFYGADCGIFCMNNSRSYCDENGTRHCKPGFTGQNCNLNQTNSAARITTEESYQPTSITKQMYVTKGSGPINNSPHNIIVTSGLTKRMIHSSPKEVKSFDTTTIDMTVENKRFPTTTVSAREPTDGNKPTTFKHNKESNNVRTTSESPSEFVSKHQITELATSLPRQKDNRTDDMTTGDNTIALTTTTTSSNTTIKIDIPEPLELYSCNMLVQGHMAGVHTEVVSVLYNALSAHQLFVPNTLLGVNAISSTFEVTDNGLDVTDVSYVVNYNGQVLRTETVVHILTQSTVARVLNEQLTSKNIHRYHPKQLAETSSHNTTKKWVSTHLPFVIVMACVCLILIAVPATFFCRRSYNRRSAEENKSSNRFNKKALFKDNPNYDMAYSIENPLYDFDSDSHKALP